MRTDRKSNKGLSVRAISGTHVVFLAFDLDSKAQKGCLGFAIRRKDITEEEDYWLEGMKTFKSTRPYTGPGEKFSSREFPIQGLQWADYSAKPNHSYVYTVVALHGKPAALKEHAQVSVKISTEGTSLGKHRICFNRGAVASQEYARRFQNKKPDEVGPAAYSWLSRGLEKAWIDFIAQAKDDSFSIRGAVYEFQRETVLDALREARRRGVDVKVIYDALNKASGPKKKNEEAIKRHRLKTATIPRTRGTIMHNKFLVLIRNGKPIDVLTGSTNLSDNGLFGHLNCVHMVRDSNLAARYLEYWDVLRRDPTTAELKAWIEEANPAPDESLLYGQQLVLSPRRGLAALEGYGRQAANSGSPALVTLAFGMHQVLQDVYDSNDGVLRIALMEKPGNGAGMAKGRKDIARIRALPNVLVALGHHITANRFDQWLKEIDRIQAKVNVRWVHTKFLLIDPLGEEPTVISGSANFSKASTDSNDENMLIIHGDKSVADVYFTEFLRVYAHHAFRESIKRAIERGDVDWAPQYLTEDCSWLDRHFDSESESNLRRLYFVGK